MVRRGEYLERMVVVPSGDLHLEGLYHRGKLRPPCVVAAPHPQQGGSMDSPVVAELAWAITRAGHATLRFNYRGVGASEGAWSGGPGEVADLESAIDQLLETTGAPAIAVAGYSFGAWAAVQAALRRPEVAALVLVSPPTALLDFSGLARVQARVLAICAEDDDRSLLAGWLGPQGKLVTVAGADHFFTSGLPQVGRHAARFVGG
ncbi:alpha/beta hydrolase [Vulgatibacter sp.]|uniref:alpha/beta hydrolase n=1 Tax=Vulgatibacter sp. TaxID=1971226 RepID=UPI0035677310